MKIVLMQKSILKLVWDKLEEFKQDDKIYYNEKFWITVQSLQSESTVTKNCNAVFIILLILEKSDYILKNIMKNSFQQKKFNSL